MLKMLKRVKLEWRKRKRVRGEDKMDEVDKHVDKVDKDVDIVDKDEVEM